MVTTFILQTPACAPVAHQDFNQQVLLIFTTKLQMFLLMMNPLYLKASNLVAITVPMKHASAFASMTGGTLQARVCDADISTYFVIVMHQLLRHF